LNPEQGVAQVSLEAAVSHDEGYNEFKIKVGRPGRWMAPQSGMERDVEVVLAVREAVGPDAKIMVDANFGYDGRLDLLEDFIRETLTANIFWLEEMVTADVGDYRVLRRMRDRLGSDLDRCITTRPRTIEQHGVSPSVVVYFAGIFC
jgi:L-alanine-DL-glutamate epimerase-like enolase superfamily enzyme